MTPRQTQTQSQSQQGSGRFSQDQRAMREENTKYQAVFHKALGLMEGKMYRYGLRDTALRQILIDGLRKEGQADKADYVERCVAELAKMGFGDDASLNALIKKAHDVRDQKDSSRLLIQKMSVKEVEALALLQRVSDVADKFYGEKFPGLDLTRLTGQPINKDKFPEVSAQFLAWRDSLKGIAQTPQGPQGPTSSAQQAGAASGAAPEPTPQSMLDEVMKQLSGLSTDTSLQPAQQELVQAFQKVAGELANLDMSDPKVKEKVRNLRQAMNTMMDGMKDIQRFESADYRAKIAQLKVQLPMIEKYLHVKQEIDTSAERTRAEEAKLDRRAEADERRAAEDKEAKDALRTPVAVDPHGIVEPTPPQNIGEAVGQAEYMPGVASAGRTVAKADDAAEAAARTREARSTPVIGQDSNGRQLFEEPTDLGDAVAQAPLLGTVRKAEVTTARAELSVQESMDKLRGRGVRVYEQNGVYYLDTSSFQSVGEFAAGQQQFAAGVGSAAKAGRSQERLSQSQANLDIGLPGIKALASYSRYAGKVELGNVARGMIMQGLAVPAAQKVFGTVRDWAHLNPDPPQQSYPGVRAQPMLEQASPETLRALAQSLQ